MKTKLHLKNDLGLNKSTIKKIVYEYVNYLPENEFTERGFDVVKELVDRRTQYYTIEESKTLVGNYLSSHDHCVVDNTGFGEFSGVEEYQSNEKYDRMENAFKTIEIMTMENYKGYKIEKNEWGYYEGRHNDREWMPFATTLQQLLIEIDEQYE